MFDIFTIEIEALNRLLVYESWVNIIPNETSHWFVGFTIESSAPVSLRQYLHVKGIQIQLQSA